MTDKPTKVDLLAHLAAIPAERQQAAEAFDAREVELVAALRRAGATWTEIGEALGNPHRQNVHRKFKPKIQETRTVRVRPKEDTATEPTATPPTTPTALPTITPGCTIHIPAGIHGARPIRLRVTSQHNNPDGSIHAVGRAVRADGTLGRQTGVTLHPVHTPHITIDSPHDDMAAGITTAGRSYAIARTGSTVYVWGDSDTPKEIHCGSDIEAATRFREITDRARPNPEETP
ncbi:hypothetical protein [Micromonospora carbonacea]|uniref:Uncharacterized protein n=1 Tax=Micromonospora carbonacea TaxID=47853 RepID=A0A1C5AB51_9ACTN|nr:hypothetical protein [Micromonospora carbonacea]SCF42389.1 hypothetical protein GA0070563_11273 [Micromonospora carbonacea]